MHSLDQPYDLPSDAISFFRANAFVKLRDVLSSEEIEYYGSMISAAVSRYNTQHRPIEERDTYGKAFLQVMNLWTKSEGVKAFVLSKRLGQIAAGLLEVQGVRLYHDQALYKEPGGGFTPWHADQYYWPLESEKTVTAWIPLQATPLEMGPLEFSAGSHNLEIGRDLPISDDSETIIERALSNSSCPHVVEPFELGEVSFHRGWLFHRAGPNITDAPRRVMTIIYMDRDMRLKQPSNENQQADWDAWCPGAIPGQIIQTDMNPIIWEQTS